MFGNIATWDKVGMDK